MQIHERLKIVRLFKGWSQEETAEKLGYTLNGYTKIERGETDVTVSKLENILQVFDIDVVRFLSLNTLYMTKITQLVKVL